MFLGCSEPHLTCDHRGWCPVSLSLGDSLGYVPASVLSLATSQKDTGRLIFPLEKDD